MTIAWYGHRSSPAPPTGPILASWGIALIEYCMAVPANPGTSRRFYSAAELKTMQEVITLVVFAGFSTWVLGEPLTWKHALGFAFIALGQGDSISKAVAPASRLAEKAARGPAQRTCSERFEP